jgi:hypothetical protein
MNRIIILNLVIALTSVGNAGSLSKDLPIKKTSASTAFTRSAWLDINRVKVHWNNRGGLDHTDPFDVGACWPDMPFRSSTVIVFDCGPWVVGKVNGVPKMGVSQWGSSYSPGPTIGGKAALFALPQDSLRYRVYKITSGDNGESNPDYRNWPADLGAPIDNHGNPRLYGDQTVWTVFNNQDTITTSSWWRAAMPRPALPVMIQQTAYARRSQRRDSEALLGNVAFVEWTIINVGDSPIESTYVSLWTDIDFSDVLSNAPAIDTVNQLGYCWLSHVNPYIDEAPRAVGFVWLYGPSVPSPGSQAIYRGVPLANHRNLPVTSFWGILDDSYSDLTSYGPAYSMRTAWNITRGFDKLGNPIRDSVTHQVTKFLYSGDPVTGTGWLCPAFTGGGSGFNMFSGPFTLASRDTQWVMAALIPVSDPDRLQCVTKLREAAASLRAMPYSSLVQTSPLEEPPPVPTSFMLEQNYPNPFNPKTVVSCQLPVASRVNLVVYDLLGREVAVLLDEHKAPGKYQVEFDGTKLSSGVYIYRLTAGDFVESKRMILLR